MGTKNAKYELVKKIKVGWRQENLASRPEYQEETTGFP